MKRLTVCIPAGFLCIAFICLLQTPPAVHAAGLVYTIQTGSYAGEASAREHFDSLARGLNRQQADSLRVEKIGPYYAVRLGSFDSPIEAEDLLDAISSVVGHGDIMRAFIREERIIRSIPRTSVPEKPSVTQEQPQAPDVQPDGTSMPESDAVHAPVTSGGLMQPPALRRDLFSAVKSNRAARGKVEEMGTGTLQLKGTILGAGVPLAIIGEEVLGIGDSVEGLRVTAIDSRSVLLSRDESRYILRMSRE